MSEETRRIQPNNITTAMVAAVEELVHTTSDAWDNVIEEVLIAASINVALRAGLVSLPPLPVAYAVEPAASEGQLEQASDVLDPFEQCIALTVRLAEVAYMYGRLAPQTINVRRELDEVCRQLTQKQSELLLSVDMICGYSVPDQALRSPQMVKEQVERQLEEFRKTAYFDVPKTEDRS